MMQKGKDNSQDAGKDEPFRVRLPRSSLTMPETSVEMSTLSASTYASSIDITWPTYKPETDKRARLIAQTDLFAGGSVRLPQRAGWLEEFVAELLSFPGRHDDQVDANDHAALAHHLFMITIADAVFAIPSDTDKNDVARKAAAETSAKCRRLPAVNSAVKTAFVLEQRAEAR